MAVKLGLPGMPNISTGVVATLNTGATLNTLSVLLNISVHGRLLC